MKVRVIAIIFVCLLCQAKLLASPPVILNDCEWVAAGHGDHEGYFLIPRGWPKVPMLQDGTFLGAETPAVLTVELVPSENAMNFAVWSNLYFPNQVSIESAPDTSHMLLTLEGDTQDLFRWQAEINRQRLYPVSTRFEAPTEVDADGSLRIVEAWLLEVERTINSFVTINRLEGDEHIFASHFFPLILDRFDFIGREVIEGGRGLVEAELEQLVLFIAPLVNAGVSPQFRRLLAFQLLRGLQALLRGADAFLSDHERYHIVVTISDLVALTLYSSDQPINANGESHFDMIPFAYEFEKQNFDPEDPPEAISPWVEFLNRFRKSKGGSYH